MIQRADAVIEGAVRSRDQARYASNGRTVYTDWRIEVFRWLCGSGPSTVTVRTDGGTIDGRQVVYSVDLSGAHRFVLFLSQGFGSRLDLRGEYVVMADTLGRFIVKGDRVENGLRPDLSRSFEEMLRVIEGVGGRVGKANLCAPAVND